ncbi:MAG: Bcr/CflA family efflux MFS transporter [Rhizobiaceae bacterium]|nr:Bcr/CflA family efflux MFS transporter [Rhizobiaceae bacterium]MCV0409146.1 Bcr/CflA family efflux MFS transporter [Rhizobiaceae bacterium]
MSRSVFGDRAVVLYCGLLMSISAFSVDITLPSFPAMAEGLSARYELIQWTITVYMFAAGIAQLLWGSASDRYGRRPILAAGLSIFLVGCLVAALAPSIAVLLIARAAQGFGAAAAIVSSRAIIRDLFSGEELARNLALATAIFAVGPIMAPLLGAGIALPFGWRAIFGVLAALAAAMLLFLLRMPETIPAISARSMRPAVFMERACRLFVHPQSRHFLILSAVAMSSMLFILASAPRVYDVEFGISGTVFAIYFALHGTGIIVGQTANRRLIPAVGTVRAMLIACGVLILAAALILATALAGIANAASTTALLILFATSYLIVYSNAAAMVLDPHGDIAGFAASFYGFISQIGSAVIVSGLVVLAGDSVTAFAATLLAICIACLGGVWLWIRR